MYPKTPLQSPTDLVRDLERLGVRAGDTLMIHASLRALGPVEGGAGGVLDALDRAVGASGTWMMVLGARDDWAWVNDLPEDDQRRWEQDLVRGADPPRGGAFRLGGVTRIVVARAGKTK